MTEHPRYKTNGGKTSITKPRRAPWITVVFCAKRIWLLAKCLQVLRHTAQTKIAVTTQSRLLMEV